MKTAFPISAAFAIGALALSQLALAGGPRATPSALNPLEGAGTVLDSAAWAEKSASTQSLGARATATASASLSGGFELKNATTVYLLVRGNSLGTLGINPTGYLDYPRVHIYNQSNQDVVFDNNNNAGFNQCTSSNNVSAPVVNYYATVRAAPVHSRDACAALVFQPGVYTFGVQPSIPGVTVPAGYTASDLDHGDTLFEVTLNP